MFHMHGPPGVYLEIGDSIPDLPPASVGCFYEKGLVYKTEITPLGAGHPHGPPGFYLGIGGSLKPPEE